MIKLTCQSCNEDKNQLKKVKSMLIDNYLNTLCNSCESRKYEPRYIVILAVNKFGISHPKVRPFIVDHRYHGKEITAAEIV